MKKKFFSLFGAFAFGLIAILSPIGAQAETISVGSFPVSPPPSYLPAPPAGTFLVPVQITGTVGLQNWQFDLTFDNTVVQEIDPGDGSSGIYGAQFTPGDPNSQSFILSGFPLNVFGVVQTVAGSYPSLPNGPTGDGTLAFILFAFLTGESGNNPNFSIQNASVQELQPVPVPGMLPVLVGAMGLFAGYRSVKRVMGRVGRAKPNKVANAVSSRAGG